MSTLSSRLTTWAYKHAPTREQLEESRWLHPLARRPHLWRFTRRSVPRGVAIGLLVSVFFVIPGLHIILAALMCVPLRGNIPLAAGVTFFSNPATVPLFVAAALWIGSLFGFHADLATLHALRQSGADLGDWEHWLLSDGAPALVIGLALLSLTAASIGYFVAAMLWRIRIARRRRARLDHRVTAERR
jgi:uncharacterized protein (DUF2062 family)